MMVNEAGSTPQSNSTVAGQLVQLTPPELAIASSTIPYPRDDNKARYLGYLASGFSIREALHAVGVTAAALSQWRQQPEFASLEKKVPEFRRTLAIEYTAMEFFRNFRLVLEKDFRILRKSLSFDDEMTEQEQDYLLKIRPNYTPSQLQVLEALFKSESPDSFDFARYVADNKDITRVTMEKQSVTMEREVG
jgi:hypothetical protein